MLIAIENNELVIYNEINFYRFQFNALHLCGVYPQCAFFIYSGHVTT